ncbi:Integrase catalytic domain-containing protein [Citrus sinensis]|nr:Integrase catalytic domain-containing protein [Citrus sinensis]
MTNKVDLEKFTSQNDFNMWRIKMEALLITQGLGDAIDPVIKNENAEVSSSRTPEHMAEIDKKARSTIILSLGDSVIREVAKEKTVAGLWAKLEQLYMTKSLANRLYIKKKMFSLRMIEGASLDEHIDEFNKVCDELETIDEGLSDESKALLLISSLPKSYEHFVDALLYGRQSLSLEEVKSALAIATEETSFETAEVLIVTKEKTQVGIGTVSLKMYDGMVRELTQVRHVPELKRNLISIGMLDQTGCVIKAKNETLKVIRGSIVIMKGTKQNGLYVLNGHTTVGEASVTERSEDKARLWHLRLGHMSERGPKELQKKGVFGSDKLSSLGFYEDCILGKASRLKFEYAVHSTKKRLAYIHFDLWGPAQVDSLSGCRYFLSLIDDYSTMVWVYALKTKDEVLERFKKWKILVETQTSLKVKALRTNNGLEFCNKDFGDFCDRHEIMRHKTVIHTPQQNGLAERMNRTLMDKKSEPAENENNSYQLVRDRKRRIVRPPKRFVVADLIAYALTVYKRFKARLVARGFTQREGIDFNEIFSPMVKHASIKVILTLVAIQDMYLEQMDVKTTFMHGELQEEIVMEQPEGYVVSGKEDHVCLLEKSLYGLKQSPRQWYLKFDSFMTKHAYKRCNYDCCVYFRDIGDGKMIYLMLYVDDMLIVCHSIDEINHLKDLLSSEFDMKDLGAVRKILGMEIIRDKKRKLMFLTQQSYVKKVLLRFGMHESMSVQTPLANHFELSAAQCPQIDAEQGKMARIPYSSAVGSLMYAMVLTRPDISHAVSIVSRFMANPGYEHLRAVQWIMRYLKGTMEFGLLYGGLKQEGHQLVGYVDSDFAGDLDKRRSQTGFIFTLGGCTVNWKATLQNVVALSTTEAEYTAAAEAFKETIWLKGMVSELGAK